MPMQHEAGFLTLPRALSQIFPMSALWTTHFQEGTRPRAIRHTRTSRSRGIVLQKAEICSDLGQLAFAQAERPGNPCGLWPAHGPSFPTKEQCLGSASSCAWSPRRPQCNGQSREDAAPAPSRSPTGFAVTPLRSPSLAYQSVNMSITSAGSAHHTGNGPQEPHVACPARSRLLTGFAG